ncbi:PREDICTED: dipeptidyl peptidase 9 [Rhagoletis zephyria]|uniref:dipeptidyl peptidase 9 n=1 Tax=Rhagoletis zephyria TaxID=28612 RepID=UPI00081147EB|nr:PREDICTED: dipeptidyl peptidase 9 [Rhagoletis zephyria]XP_017469950.1 PREDICTED: dipeptidyl peptidase 9 [Rhagoletis zephyria]XP_017469951.1 PREDICTED: dipeptidyl peptidase 9 [Rhagoletis zephyria]XP_017469952.1 PREDICTED: dipeptidyl peptidase 9 [Rhagoletis zephyria]XP_017469953.1 PREDICTED: dipeptidyl peptidase 9 [Rhagoletis zephyria]XP_017469954.1 PREDICTED: dipeptidyl peptidase 9 [Rhagoletis zephyria]XP_017469955.1 PREDICTED: dipeptidyl peptidase 9 [Rhagoletis zephyria]XP_017469956.1 PRE
MDTSLTHQRNRLQSASTTTTTSAANVAPLSSSISGTSAILTNHNSNSVGNIGANRAIGSASVAIMTGTGAVIPINPLSQLSSQSSPSERISSTSSLANLLDGFTSRVSGDRAQSAASTPSSISSLGTTANAFYSSLGLAFNSLTSPISTVAAAAHATTAEAAAVVVAAASALSNHLSSPTSGTPPHMDELDDDDDCEDDDDDNDGHVPAPTPKKTWSEIKAIVNDMRKHLINLSSMMPSNIQFRTLSDGRVRCYFLSTPPNAWEPTLLYADINMNGNEDMVAENDSPTTEMNGAASDSGMGMAAGSDAGADVTGSRLPSPTSSQASSPTSAASFPTHSQNKRLQWKTVLQQPMSSVAAGTASGGVNPWSREFQLLQERKRLSTWGITSFELHKPSGKIVFPCFSDLYQCLDTGYTNWPLFPTQLRTCPQWAALDPQICPQNSDLIAYISGSDIWVTHTVSGHEERLTFAHDGRRSIADDPLSAGVPSYIMLEEFSRFQGYWWQPKSDDGVYRIVYEEVDESDVCMYTFPSSQAMPGEMEEYRFPRAGTANAKSKLKLVQFVLNESLQISDVCIKDLPYTLSLVFPWLEYIVRVGWTPDSNYVWMQGMNRKQQRLDLVLIPLDNFCETYTSSASSPSGSADHSWKSPYCRAVSPLQVIYSQTSDSWINVHDLLYFLEITDTTVTFLWASEETGFRHLYLVTSSLGTETLNGFKDTANNFEMSSRTNSTSSAASANMDMHTDFIDSVTLHPRIINKVALTSGEWEVLHRNIWVDKAQQLVYFIGLRDTPLEKHLYVVSLQRPEHIRLLTEPGYSYQVEFNESCQLMLQVYCNIQRLPSCKVMRVTQTCQNGGVNGIQLSMMGYLHEGGKPEPQYCPQVFRPQLPSGEIVYAMVFKPHNFHLGIKYPTVLNVYGGPEVQTVNNTFKGKHQLRMHMLAAQGYCVICIDSRGSRHRGLKFETHIRCRMGQVELHDQVAALRILADQLGYIDMSRVAIHGWSYGGYLSLMGLVQYPDVFKIAIAGAPVTNWEYYDTGYTERYMDLPHNNKRGYTAGSVLNYIHAFPEEENRLLLIHGLIDENVHFYHTSQLISALNRANKPYNLHVFPEERHSLRNLESNKNYETKLLAFLQNL